MVSASPLSYFQAGLAAGVRLGHSLAGLVAVGAFPAPFRSPASPQPATRTPRTATASAVRAARERSTVLLWLGTIGDPVHPIRPAKRLPRYSASSSSSRAVGRPARRYSTNRS